MNILARLLCSLFGLILLFGLAVNTVNATDTATPFYFPRDMKMGDTGQDVLLLQQTLNKNYTTQVATAGAGSLGSESIYFGMKTKLAVIKFQEKYADQILRPLGLSKGTGYVGKATVAMLVKVMTENQGVVKPK